MAMPPATEASALLPFAYKIDTWLGESSRHPLWHGPLSPLDCGRSGLELAFCSFLSWKMRRKNNFGSLGKVLGV